MGLGILMAGGTRVSTHSRYLGRSLNGAGLKPWIIMVLTKPHQPNIFQQEQDQQGRLPPGSQWVFPYLWGGTYPLTPSIWVGGLTVHAYQV